MEKTLKTLTFRLKLSAIFMLIYVFSNSFLLLGNIGLISITIVVLYFLINFRYKNFYSVLFICSFLLLMVAGIFNLFDVTDTLMIPIKKLSEWAYIFMLMGALRLISTNRFGDNIFSKDI
jgi:hypothetical protein